MPDQCSLQWVEVNTPNDGPTLQNHAGAICQDVLYIHGGVTSNNALCKKPSSCLYKIQLYPELGSWLDITTADSPQLSQHICLTFKDRYLIFIGGWNGRIRIPGVHTFDTLSNNWLPPALNEPLLTGFPQGAGLSAHSAQVIRSSVDKNEFSAIIIGREGSLRIQRKAGNIYLLYGYLLDEDLPTRRMKFVYCEADSSLTASSRSYHTSTAISPTTLVTIGGCKSNSIDILKWKVEKGRKKDHLFFLNWPGSLDYPLTSCTTVTKFIQDIEQKNVKLTPLAPSNQNGWRGHCIVPGVGGLFIGTGEGYNALKNEPLNSAYLLKYSENGSRPIIYEIGTINESRAYAVCDVCRSDGTGWLHGGLGPQGRTMNTLMKLIRMN